MAKKLFFLPLAIIAIIITLSACSAANTIEDEEKGVIIDKTKNYEYVIIYGKDAGDEIVHQASLLRKELKDKCGIEAYTQSDWDYRPNDSLENNGSEKVIEILLGTTNRQSSIEAHNNFETANEYVIQAKDNVLIFAATSEKLLIDSINEFKETYLEQKNLSITIPQGIISKKNDYSFFNIATRGASECSIVIPDNASTRVRNMASNISSKINSLCNTNIKVYEESKISSTDGCILIGNLNDKDCQKIIKELEIGQSIVKQVNSKVIIAGYNDTALLNGIFSFLGNIVMKHDKLTDGSPYVYFPSELELSDTWLHIIPNIPGSVVVENNQQSSNLVTVKFEDVEEDEYLIYEQLLKDLEFIITSKKQSGDGSNVFLSAAYNHIDAALEIDATIDLQYNLTTRSINMSLSYVVNLK